MRLVERERRRDGGGTRRRAAPVVRADQFPRAPAQLSATEQSTGILKVQCDETPHRPVDFVYFQSGGGHEETDRQGKVLGSDHFRARRGGEALDHNDLHAFNVLAGPRFYDWGDSVVAHPFASLLVADRPEEREAYLPEFADLAPRAGLDATVELAVRVGRIARALVWRRAVDASGEWADAPFRWLATLPDAN